MPFEREPDDEERRALRLLYRLEGLLIAITVAAVYAVLWLLLGGWL